jgi:hypothetical protein
MGGIAGQYTKFEKVEIQSTLCTINSAGNWTVVMKLKNTGTATANLIGVFINDIEVNNYATGWVNAEWNTNMTSTEPITSGATKTIEVYIDADLPGTTLSSGTTVNIKVHSAGGMDYIKLVERNGLHQTGRAHLAITPLFYYQSLAGPYWVYWKKSSRRSSSLSLAPTRVCT